MNCRMLVKATKCSTLTKTCCLRQTALMMVSATWRKISLKQSLPKQEASLDSDEMRRQSSWATASEVTQWVRERSLACWQLRKWANYWQMPDITARLIQAGYNYRMSIKILLAAAGVALACLALLHNQQQLDDSSFQQFRASFGKQYEEEEASFRRHVFLSNKHRIDQHNSQPNRTYEMTINHFADLTQEEFRQYYLGILGNRAERPSLAVAPSGQTEVDIDWRAQGKVTRVKNQGMCASCWAFCVVAAVESAYLIKGVNQELSEQQLVDCSNTYGNLGCHGGELEYTYRYIKDRGLNSESAYPYVAKDQNCRKTHGPFKIVHYSQGITCAGLYAALKSGPVAVTVEALAWAFYKEGVFSDCGNEVNHGVLVVGATGEYWLVKNSWGAQWGSSGYIKLKRGNTCSVCESPFATEV